jgi:hypothetical protein
LIVQFPTAVAEEAAAESSRDPVRDPVRQSMRDVKSKKNVQKSKQKTMRCVQPAHGSLLPSSQPDEDACRCDRPDFGAALWLRCSG